MNLKLFKNILKEASEVFQRPMHDVTYVQFNYMNRGRITQEMIRCFGYAALRNSVAPSPDMSSKSVNDARDLIRKLVNHA